ncbi:MAG TPA: CHRD domain-containing protein, partial [Polyangiaceae bacterium]|nr:CHRD domain-containing protein [Polyangiaceae bacterium]
MKRAISLSIACVVLPIAAAFGGCSSSGGGAAPAGSSSSRSQSGQTVTVDGSVFDGASSEAEEASVTTVETTAYVATLNGYQVVPTVVRTGAQGTGQFTLLADGVTLQYSITASGLSSTVTSVNFHVGSAVDTGGISHQIVVGADASTSGGSLSLSGSITLSATSPDEVDALPVGQLYVDISTTNNSGGEVRGQIVLPGATVMVAKLTGGQEVPPVSSVYSASAAFVISADQTTVQYHLSAGANLTESVI